MSSSMDSEMTDDQKRSNNNNNGGNGDTKAATPYATISDNGNGSDDDDTDDYTSISLKEHASTGQWTFVLRHHNDQSTELINIPNNVNYGYDAADINDTSSSSSSSSSSSPSHATNEDSVPIGRLAAMRAGLHAVTKRLLARFDPLMAGLRSKVESTKKSVGVSHF
jgi:hypothetical protein